MITFISKNIRPTVLIVAFFLTGLNAIYATADPLSISPLKSDNYLEVESTTAKILRAAAIRKCLLNTSGTVYSINAASKTSATSNASRVEVTVTKTGGKAKSEVTISTVSTSAAGTLTTVKKRYTFENGNYTRTKKFKVWKVDGLQIKVRIENKSFSNKFEYTTRVDEI